jgi:hypothetical protein
MFGISTTNDDTVETVVQAAQRRIEAISSRVPLWCLPDYIDSQSDPQAELCRTIIENFCKASVISSKSKTEDRSNYVQKIGECLLQTDGLAEVFSKYITHEKFAESFFLYIDKTEPMLRQVAEEIGDHTRAYSNVIKTKLVVTAGWLWKEDDYSSIIARVLCEYHVIKILMPLCGNQFISYDSALSQLRSAVFQKNKIPVTLITQAYPALHELVNALNEPKECDISERLLEILQRDTESLKHVFLSTNEVHITFLAERLADISLETLREIYDTLPSDGAKSDENSFIHRVRAIASQHLEQSLTTQIQKLWFEKSQTHSPNDWAEKNSVPIALLFSNEEIPRDIQTAIEKPKTFTTEKLKAVLQPLQQWTLPEISEKQKIIENAKRTIEKLSDSEAKAILKSLLEKQPDIVLQLLQQQ